MASRLADISVVIATYNRAHLVTRALDSVARQIERPREIVVVDDASQDDTPEVVTRWAAKADVPVNLIVSSSNKGLGATRNIAMKAATGSLIAPLDSDDEFLPHALAAVARPLDDYPHAVVSFADGLVTFADGSASHRHIAQHIAPGEGTTALDADGLYRLDDPQAHFLTTSFIPTCSAIFRRGAAEAVGWMPEVRYGEDWLFWLRLSELGDFLCRFDNTSIIHRQGDNLTDDRNALHNSRQIFSSLASIRRGDHIATSVAQNARLDRVMAKQATAYRYFASREGIRAYRKALREIATLTDASRLAQIACEPKSLLQALRFSL